MSNLTETVAYDVGVYQLEITDPVAGGSTGAANKPLINLANRTAYLKKHLDDIEKGVFVPAGLAVLNSPTFTGDPKAPTPVLGDNDTSIATTAFVQGTLGGYLTKSVAGGATVTLTAVEAGNGIIEFTGVLTANIAVVVPTSPTRLWIFKNSTTGAYTVTVKTAAGAGVVVTQGKRAILFTDGTNVLSALSDLLADLLLIDGAGSGIDADLLDGAQGALYARLASPTFTGTPAVPTAAAGTNTTQAASTAFATKAAGDAGIVFAIALG
jgi:hypothetical protein